MSEREKIERDLLDAYQHFLDGAPEAAQKAVHQALQGAQRLADPHLLARAHIDVSRSYRWLNKPHDAAEHILSALGLFSQFEDNKLLATARYMHGRILLQLGLTDDSYEELSSALEWATQNEDFELQLKILDQQAVVFTADANFEKAEELFNKIQDMQDQHDFPHMRALVPMHWGFYHTRLGENAAEQGDEQAYKDHYQIAQMRSLQAFDAALENGQAWYQFVALCNAAECAAVQSDFDRAVEFLAKVEELPTTLLEIGAVHYLYTKSEVANRSGNSQQAIRFGLDALEASKSNPNADNVMNAHKRVADAYESAGDFKAALTAHKKYHAHFKQSLTRRAYWQDRMAEYRSKVKDIQHELHHANERANKMTEAALEDPLTGLGNRRKFDQTLSEYDSDPDLNFAIAILDLDHFKQINDKFSHVLGDDVLKFVSDILLENTRSNDLVARIGGEEFAILMPYANQQSAILVCERIRKEIYGWDWQEVIDELEVSASIGVAVSGEGQSAHEVFEIADARLFRAKSRGRNQVEAFALEETKSAS